MRFEPAGQVGFGMKVKKCFAEGFNAREWEAADGLLLPGLERSQAAVQLTQCQFNLTLIPSFLPAFLPALGYANPYKRISA
jgi:hypothetical protein